MIDLATNFVQIVGVEHRFGLRKVLHNVSLEVHSGQIGIVMGANGSGKSTLLRIIAGLLPPTSGLIRVHINEYNINKNNINKNNIDKNHLDNSDLRRHLGYVAPDLTLYKELTGAENLEFFAQLKGISLTRDDLRHLLSKVGLKGRGRDLVGGYSSGMRQRLKYAFALLGDPSILLLDEPTANLDVHGIAMVEEIIQEHLKRPGRLVIVATNEPREEEWGTVSVRLGQPIPTP